MVDIVPIAPAAGLPDLDFGPISVASVAPLLSDAISVLAAFGPQPWGIYSDGEPVVIADTVLDLGYSKTYTISDYPIEDGGFASYDKVEQPYEGRVRFASGGSPDVRAALLASIEGIVGDLNLYDVVTPDEVYVNANLTRQEYRRTQSEAGGSLLQVDVTLQEVRILSGDMTTDTADPASSDQQNGGTVQPTTPTASQTIASLPIFASGTVPPPTLQ